jgi:23S rRNA (uridine2552-2'-O)-methyltransferase
MSKQWLQKHKHDTYYKQAKADGYRSRAAYKLKQINNKFKVIRRGDIVLDLGAAPGGWTQVAAELVGSKGKIVGVDLNAIEELKDHNNNIYFLTGDITDEEVVGDISQYINEKDVNVIISDAAPNISGNYSMDQAKSIYLAEAVLKLARIFLKPHGNLVVKIFQGEDFPEFFQIIKTQFRFSKVFSPKASRVRSSEVYVIGLNYKI